jgi:hypothetical protein
VWGGCLKLGGTARVLVAVCGKKVDFPLCLTHWG